MLMDIKCSAAISIDLKLTFDDGSIKYRNVAVGDLIDVDFNKNGVRIHTIGKVFKIVAEGSNPEAWAIYLDSSDDFSGTQYRFAPTAILDLEVIMKKDATKYIATTNDYTSICALRVVRGRLQYTQDGINWFPIRFDHSSLIKDEEGTVPEFPGHPHPDNNDDDVIRDEEQ